MANKTVKLVWYARTPRGWRYFPAIHHIKDGMLTPKPGWVKENGVEVEYPKGRFMLRSYDSEGRTIYTAPDSQNPHVVQSRLSRAQLRAVVRPEHETKLAVLRRAVAAYISDCKKRNAMEAARDATVVLTEFTSICKGITYTKSITRQNILDWHAALRDKGNSDRTIHNKHARLNAFLRFCKVDVGKGSFMPPRPRYEKKLPTMYTSDEIADILSAVKDEGDGALRLALLMALKLGLRELEIVYAEWPDVHWHDSVFRVQGKTHWTFKVKDSEQRDVPIPADVLAELKAWHESHKDTRLMVGTKNDKPNMHFLRSLKRLVNRAGLNCGTCEGCTSEIKECERWTLHKYRRTWATTLLRSGIDPRTVQAWGGWADLETVLRYLRPAAATEMQDKINAINW
jgi:integrase